MKSERIERRRNGWIESIQREFVVKLENLDKKGEIYLIH